MPKRQRTKRIDASPIQGEGAYVLIKSMTLKETQAFQAKLTPLQNGSADPMEAERLGREFFAEYVVEWNLVDDDDNPLPSPHGNPDALAELTVEEFRFITEAMQGGNGIAEKNSNSKS
jgi:hypothetical protein